MSSDKDKIVHDISLTPADLNAADVPPGVDRRAFMMRSAVVGAAAVISGCSGSSQPERSAATSAPAPAAPAQPAAPALSADLDVVKKAKGPVMTVLEEFYK